MLADPAPGLLLDRSASKNALEIVVAFDRPIKVAHLRSSLGIFAGDDGYILGVIQVGVEVLGRLANDRKTVAVAACAPGSFRKIWRLSPLVCRSISSRTRLEAGDSGGQEPWDLRRYVHRSCVMVSL